MLLDKLEIKGFKSFGDKVSIIFNEGVTGIVGPNGSGKSNVVDAIRWVLGEQSTRALRSEKMDNIIFNGTRRRKPLQMAEVSMSFKNTKNLLPTEYSEVTISRRLYRSGDGEYLLNGVNCRLKDIQNLFMDTGIGSDSYAIIELKMVDEILSDQNNSRRNLFEEAAGISKFKKRKKETFKKLQDTDADLERVEDLLHEIEKNLRSLERQAKQAERFLDTKKTYKEMSIVLARESVSGQLEDLSRTEQQIDKEQTQKVSLDKQIAEKEAALENTKKELVEKEKLLASRQKTFNTHVSKIRQFESEKKIKSERLKFLSDKSNALHLQIDGDMKSNERAKFSIDSLMKEKENLDKIFHETSFQLEEIQQQFETQKQKSDSLKGQVTETNLQVQSKQTAVYQLRKSLEISQVQQTSLKQEMERESSESSEKSADLANFDQKVDELEKVLEDKRNRLEFLLDRQDELDRQIETTSQSLASLKEQFQKNGRRLDAKQNEYNLTKSMIESLEGYPEAVRFLKQQTTWGESTVLLSDIIATKNEEYQLAIEHFLTPLLNYYIVETENQAIKAVNLLSNAAKGKASFLILEKFKNYQSSLQPQFENAVPAIQELEFDEKYRYLVNYIFDSVYIVVGNLNRVPDDEKATFITQDGRIIKKHYSIAGGSVGLFEGKKLGRIKNMEKVGKEIKSLQNKIDELEKFIRQNENDLKKYKENSVAEEISDLQKQINLINEEYIALKTRKEQFSDLLESSANKRETILEKLSQISEVITENTPKLSEEEEALATLQDQLLELNESLELEVEKTASLSSSFNEQNLTFHRQQNQLNSLEKEIEYKQNSYDTGKARLENNKKDLQHTDDEIRQVENSTDVGEQQLISLYEEKESLNEGVREVEKDYYKSRGSIAEYEKEIKEIRNRRENSVQVIQQLQEKISAIRIEINAVKERVKVEFETDLEKVDVSELSGADTAKADLESEVNKMRERLEKMGPINHMAIEAFNEIKERHEFITKQKADLDEAKNSLLQTIEEIDAVAKENFLESFTTIREHFVEVFRSLFNEEDTCDLKLQDPTEPLNSKIDIIARPKGKKPLTINQLSGGEKTLTAIALLFAIYLLKPAPFCIFDEVDAPLDDANIDKFNNIIRKFSENSQFILVTHNKRTMVNTDIMYGITQIEQGVTAVVPVDLRDVPEK